MLQYATGARILTYLSWLDEAQCTAMDKSEAPNYQREALEGQGLKGHKRHIIFDGPLQHYKCCSGEWLFNGTGFALKAVKAFSPSPRPRVAPRRVLCELYHNALQKNVHAPYQDFLGFMDKILREEDFRLSMTEMMQGTSRLFSPFSS
jgi:hypothetical protein